MYIIPRNLSGAAGLLLLSSLMLNLSSGVAALPVSEKRDVTNHSPSSNSLETVRVIGGLIEKNMPTMSLDTLRRVTVTEYEFEDDNDADKGTRRGFKGHSHKALKRQSDVDDADDASSTSATTTDDGAKKDDGDKDTSDTDKDKDKKKHKHDCKKAANKDKAECKKKADKTKDNGKTSTASSTASRRTSTA